MSPFLAKRLIKFFERNRQIGEISILLPSPPIDFTKIANWDLTKKEQKFQYTVQPKKCDEPTESFLKQEFDRILNGYWFFNNGNLEYLTGFHYFFLNYWTDKGKKMIFVDAQRDVAYWWLGIEYNTNLAGGNLITRRRWAKTHFGTGILYYRTATRPERRGGLQSKTNSDGKTVFGKLISSWAKLPDWLKPLDSGETRPATSLDFFESRKRSSKGHRKIYTEALNSSIDFRPATEEAYDGEEIHTYYDDEVGKTAPPINTDARWEIVKYCLLDGSNIVGKAFRTTTVEEMEKKGGANMLKTWKASAMAKLNLNTGRTPSLLTNLFVPADYGYRSNHPVTGESFIDEYGYSKREFAKSYILSTWEGLDGEELRAAQRKNPLIIKHAFQPKEGDGEFDNTLLEMQKDYLENEAPKNLIRKVRFFKDDEGLVKWEDDPKGKFEIVWDFSNRSDSNKRTLHPNGQWAPAKADEFCIGVDPVAATITTGKEKSMSVAYVYRKGVSTDPENSGLVVCRYAQRTKYKADFHRNVMLLCQYFGCKANYESDVDDYYEKFLEERYKNYIMWRPKNTIDPQRKNITVKYGTPSKDPYALQKHTQTIHEYIKARWHKIYWLELVQQLIDYDIEDRTKFDEVIAFGMALLGGFDTIEGTVETKVVKFMQKYIPKIGGRIQQRGRVPL